MERFTIFFQSFLIFAAMVAMVAVGFGHRPANAPLSPELAAYVAAGGSLSDICGTADRDGNPSIVDCGACRIGDTLSLVKKSCSSVVKNIPKVRVFGFIARRIAETRDLDAARLVRAPPQA